MQFTSALLFVVALATSTVVAQFPDCYMTCTSSADFGKCSPSDNACLCTNESFVNAVAQCLTNTCSQEDLVTALSISQELCEKVGVTQAAPSVTTPSPSSGSSSSSSSSTSSSSEQTSPSPSSPSPSSDSSDDTDGALSVSVHTMSMLAGILAGAALI